MARHKTTSCVLNGAALPDAAAVYRQLSEALHAPVYFGHNPDALWDAIGEYHGEPIEIVWRHSGQSAARFEQPAQQAIGQCTLVGFLDVMPAMIDEVHVVHARRAGRHAGQARQAAIDMAHLLMGRRPIALEQRVSPQTEDRSARSPWRTGARGHLKAADGET